MEFSDVFRRLPSRYQLEEFLVYLSAHPDRFPELIDLVFANGDPKASFRALWACEKVSQRWPEWWTEEQHRKIRGLAITSSHTGMIRLGLSILNTLPRDEEPDIELMNRLYDLIIQPSYPPGVQSQAMRLLYELVKNNEDLRYEFFLVLDDVSEQVNSPAFRATRKNLLKRQR